MGLSALVRASALSSIRGGEDPQDEDRAQPRVLSHILSLRQRTCVSHVWSERHCVLLLMRTGCQLAPGSLHGQDKRPGEMKGLFEGLGHCGPRVSPDTPISLQMVIGVGLLDRGEKKGRSVPENGVSGKINNSDPSVAL